MKNTNICLTPILLLGIAAIVLASGCSKDDGPVTWTFSPSDNVQTEVQTALISMGECDIIEFTEGTFNFTGTLSIEGKNCVTIRGKGKDKTILDFTNQTQGAQGVYASNVSWFKIENLTIKNPVGDGLKIKDSDGVSMLSMGTIYSDASNPENGAYGLYPVTCTNVYINDCYVSGASDAGIYVGQSKDVIVSNCLIEGNVAGLEIENCMRADVFGNTARNNTGGIMAFDLENLPVIPTGNTCRIFNNIIENNSLKSFAPPGTTVSHIPVGTGIMILSYDNVEIFGNTITNNNVMGIGLLSMNTVKVLEGNFNPEYENYDPYNYNIKIHDNTISRTTTYPPEADRNSSANVLIDNYPNGDMPTIIYDGFVAPSLENDPTEGICIQENGVTFVDINVPLFDNKRTDLTPHTCSPFPDAIAPVVVNAPGI